MKQLGSLGREMIMIHVVGLKDCSERAELLIAEQILDSNHGQATRTLKLGQLDLVVALLLPVRL